MEDKKITKIGKLRNELKEMDFSINFEDKEEYIIIEMIFDKHGIKPYERNRKSGKGGHMYDPLSTYKIEMLKIITPKVKEYIQTPLDGYCYVEIERYFKMPKDFSKKKIKAGLDKVFRPILKKNDNDNVEKTIFDLFNNLIYHDDGQIIENTTRKYYNTEEKTVVKMKVYKNKMEIKGR